MILILTSSCDRHRQILQQMNFRDEIDFVVKYVVPQGGYPTGLAPPEVIEQGKARAFAKIQRTAQNGYVDKLGLQSSETVIMSAESIVFCNDQVLDTVRFSNASSDVEEQERTLAALRDVLLWIRGKGVDVVSVLCLAQADNTANHVFFERTTRVWMKTYTSENIERYLSYSDEMTGGVVPFAIDGRGVAFVDSIDGSYTNILGLPIEELRRGFQSEICRDRVTRSGVLRWERPVEKKGYTLRFLAMGDINLELAFRGSIATEAQFPHEAVQELSGSIDRRVGGDAALFALQSRRAGCPEVAVLGSIGDDFFGQEILRQLSKEGVSTQMVSRKSNQFSDLVLTLPWHGPGSPPLRIVDLRSAITVGDVNLFEEYIKKVDLLFVSGRCLSDSRRNAACRALQLAHQAGVKTLLNLPYDIERNVSLNQLCQEIKTYASIWVMYDSTIQHWLNVQAEVEALPEPLRAFCQALILRRASGNESLLLTEKQCLKIPPSFEEGGEGQQPFSTVQSIVTLLYQLMAPRVLLASRSPRRVQLLRQVMAPNKLEIFPSKAAEESRRPGEPIEEYSMKNALKKALWVYNNGGFSPYVRVILGADTNIVFDDAVIGQPLTDKEARSILRQLSGKTHLVMTGVALIDTQTSEEVTVSIATKVHMRALSLEELEEYIETQEPIGKAGGYGIQGMGATLVENIEGSYSNVVGLPLERVTEMLEKDFGLSIWDLDSVNAFQLDPI